MTLERIAMYNAHVVARWAAENSRQHTGHNARNVALGWQTRRIMSTYHITLHRLSMSRVLYEYS
jgi:hypothetical protein